MNYNNVCLSKSYIAILFSHNYACAPDWSATVANFDRNPNKNFEKTNKYL